MRSTTALMLVAGLSACPLSMVFAQPMPETGEFQINQGQIDSNQDDPAVASDAMGNFVVVWESAGGPNLDGIFARRYNASAVAQGSDFQVNNNPVGNQNEPDVGVANDGRFVIVYESDTADGDGEGILARRFAADGTPAGNEFLVNKDFQWDQVRPAIAAAGNGAFVVVWQTEFRFNFREVFFNEVFDSRQEIRMLRFDNQGNALDGSEFIVSQNTADGSASRMPDVAIRPNGSRAVVVWDRGGGIVGRRYNLPTASPIGGEFQISAPGSDDACPSIGMAANGDFVVAWERDLGPSNGVVARRFLADGSPNGSEFIVNTFTPNDQDDPATSVRTDSAGNFVIVWESFDQDAGNNDNGVFGQYYNSAGMAIGGEFQVNETTARNQDDPAVGMAPNGDFLVAWESRQSEQGPRGGGNGDDGVYGRLFSPPPVGGTDPDCMITGDMTTCPGATGLMYSVAETTGATSPTFAWSVMGDAMINGSTDGASVMVDVDPTCGNFVLTVTVTDDAGNTGMCNLSVSVEDSTPPMLTVPGDVLNLECPAETTPLATGEATATDNCPAPVTITHSDDVTPGCGQTVSIVRTWTAIDVCGNRATGMQTITVVDTTPPTISVPTDMTVECGDPTTSDATGMATGSDTCGGVTVSESDSFAQGCGNTGVITRTWTVTDECGQMNSGVQTITIVDNTRPSITCPPDVTVLRGENTWPAATGEATGSDTCGETTATHIDSVEPAPSPLFEIITRTWTVTDVCGNASTCVQTITVEDYCVWDQGDWDGIDGQSAETETATSTTFAADDFCLKEGYVYEIERICVTMLTDAEDPKATLTIRADNAGCPGEVIDCGTANSVGCVVLEHEVMDGLNLVQFDFNFQARTEVDEYDNEVDIPALWLKGGCYWVSPQGIGAGQNSYERYFWATAGATVIGSIPKAQAEPFKIDDWTPVDGLNVSCRNFAFRLHGEKCCILQDNGGPADDIDDGQDTTGVGCAGADDFVIPPCSEATEVCFFSAYVWTNCDCTRAKLEFLNDDCGVPAEDHLGTRNGFAPFLADKCVDMGRTIMFEDQELTLYRIEWHDIGFPIGQAVGSNGWASIRVQGSGSLQEKAVVAYADRCGTSSDMKFSAGHVICPTGDIFDWTSVERDFAFCIATRGGEDQAGPNRAAAGEPEGCAADFNGDGASTVTDLLGFMDVWFQGCQ